MGTRYGTGCEKLPSHLLERGGEGRRHNDLGAYPRGYPIEDFLTGLRYIDTQKLELLAEHAVDGALSRRCTLGKPGFLVLSGGIHGVVLHCSEARPSIELGESDFGVTVEEARVVLHHAFQTSRLLEGCLCLILELRVDELRHLASCLLQHLCIGLNPENESVGVSGVGRKATLIGHVALWANGGLEERLKLVVLNVDSKLLSRLLVFEVTDRTHCLPWPSRHRERVDLQPETLRDSDEGRGSLEDEPVGVLEEHDPPTALRRPLVGQPGLVEERMHISMAVRLGEHRVGVFGVHG
mmetsp:Transcript_17080/g.34594  ORF Transcript_17080/g.34594 Transcript_17080/m.34594 type:complete len:296 (-) Transcript_17080:1032-1919(-)